MTKVLLIRPDLVNTKFSMKTLGIRQMPIGLLYLGAILKNLDVDVKICDEIVGDSSENDIIDFKPDYVGITVSSPIINRAVEIGQIVKKYGCKYIIGGPHSTVRPMECFEKTPCDFVALGEAEETIKELLTSVDLKDIKGIGYRQNGEVKINPIRPIQDDLDSIPFPDFDLIDSRKYRGDTDMGFHVRDDENSLRIITSRGCRYECTFCARHAIFGRKVRYRSIGNVMEEIIENSTKLNTKKIIFFDDTFTENPDRVVEICEEFIKMDKGYTWSCFARVNLSEELLRIMHRAGCRMIGYGVESGSKKVLDMTKKKIKVEDIKPSFHLTRKIGIRTKAFIMVGLPGEDDIEFEKSLQLVKTLKADYVYIAIFTPLPGSEVFDSIHNSDIDYNKRSIFVPTDPILKKRQARFMNSYYFRFSYIINNLIHFDLHELYYFFGLVKVFLKVRFKS
jgi:anaerobic magnesium-protoporphyrin IX monomethyl ester cyclase